MIRKLDPLAGNQFLFPTHTGLQTVQVLPSQAGSSSSSVPWNDWSRNHLARFSTKNAYKVQSESGCRAQAGFDAILLAISVELHMLVLDGVYTLGKSGKAKFHRVKAPNQTELRTLLNRVIQRVVRILEKEGLLIPDPEQPWLDLDFHDPMDTVSAASTEASDRRYRIAMGPHSGSRTLTLHDPSLVRTDRPVKALTADRDGFSLNVAVSCQPYQRDRLQTCCSGAQTPA